MANRAFALTAFGAASRGVEAVGRSCAVANQSDDAVHPCRHHGTRGRRACSKPRNSPVTWFVVLGMLAALLPLIAANDEMAFAAAAEDDGDFDKAVSHYKKGGQESIKAL